MGGRVLPAAWGVWAALTLPVHLRGHRLRRLTSAVEVVEERSADVSSAYGVGVRVLRVLRRLRVPGWRNTCLYRSALHCLLLRRAGHPAVVRIGARRGIDEIEAHAWVEVRGEPIVEAEARYAPLERHSVPVG